MTASPAPAGTPGRIAVDITASPLALLSPSTTATRTPLRCSKRFAGTVPAHLEQTAPTAPGHGPTSYAATGRWFGL